MAEDSKPSIPFEIPPLHSLRTGDQAVKLVLKGPESFRRHRVVPSHGSLAGFQIVGVAVAPSLRCVHEVQVSKIDLRDERLQFRELAA